MAMIQNKSRLWFLSAQLAVFWGWSGRRREPFPFARALTRILSSFFDVRFSPLPQVFTAAFTLVFGHVLHGFVIPSTKAMTLLTDAAGVSLGNMPAFAWLPSEILCVQSLCDGPSGYG
jgi:hypothetical protein